MTPPGSQGFAVHYDTHDTAIIQITGSKHWRVYDSPVELPLETQPHDKKIHASKETLLDIAMQPGDMLYIPRGFLHEASANEDLSLHVTLGIHQRRWIEVLHEALKESAHADAVLRKNASPETAAQIAEAVAAMLSPQTLCETLESMTNRYVNERYRNDLSGQLGQIARLKDLSEDSIVAVRPDMLCSIEQTEHATKLTFSNKTLTLAPYAAAIINELQSRTSVRAGDLLKHDEKALKVVRKLIQDGFAIQLSSATEPAAQTAVA